MSLVEDTNQQPMTCEVRWIDSPTVCRTFSVTLSSPSATYEEAFKTMCATNEALRKNGPSVISAKRGDDGPQLFIKPRGFPLIPVKVTRAPCGLLQLLPPGAEIERLIFSEVSFITDRITVSAPVKKNPEKLSDIEALYHFALSLITEEEPLTPVKGLSRRL